MSLIYESQAHSSDALLRETLEATGQRFTEQRAAVYRYLRSTSMHPTADEVFTSVRTEISDISLATVYKALETLVSCGLAVKLSFGDGSARYDARTDDHFHTRCLRCGVVRDVHGSSRSAAISELPTAGDFVVQGYRLEILGHCSTCSS
jgi:Fe2+ or Zn2+ uptake regulation protein